MPLKTLKFLAMVSKVILMMGVGSSFKEGDKHENLNMLLSELSPSVLLILDTVAVRCWRRVVEVDGRVTPIVTGYRCVCDGGGTR